MAEDVKVTPAQRAAFFNQLTRQHIKALPSVTLTEGGVETIELPKARLLSKIQLLVQATVTVTHASSTAGTAASFAPWTLLKGVKVSLNNGFEPFRLNGKGLYLYNLMRNNAHVLDAAASGRSKVVQAYASDEDGLDNTVRFIADLPISINDRDPIGLILLQNPETGVTIELSAIDAVSSLLSTTTGFTVALKSLTVTPIIHTFSIPAAKQAFPDITLLKLVQSYEQAIAAAGEVTVKFPVGNTYRRIAMYIEDASGNPVLDSEITGNLELSFNQADVPYTVPPYVLAGNNHEIYGDCLGDGIYIFDFSHQGLANYGGARDYIDTERLSEFWFKFTAAEAGKITYVRETLARLKS